MTTVTISNYGVREQIASETELDLAAESLQTLGYAIVDGGYSRTELETIENAFETARSISIARAGGIERLRRIDEHNTIRAAFSFDRRLLQLAVNRNVLDVVGRLLGEYFVLSQQNGVINPVNKQAYNQGSWHRDLAYQHVVFSRPMAINALFCLDSFTIENGATAVLSGTHKQEQFPSEAFLKRHAIQVCAPAGSYIILDCMIYHTGSSNQTQRERRAVNHVYTSPILRQQIDIPRALGEDYSRDERLRRILGYEVTTPLSVEEFWRSRELKLNN